MLDDAVADGVAERVVDVLEVVEVENQQSRMLAVAAAQQHLALKL